MTANEHRQLQADRHRHASHVETPHRSAAGSAKIQKGLLSAAKMIIRPSTIPSTSVYTLSATMVVVSHRIDANADTVIILKHPNGSFATWNLTEVGGDVAAIAEETTGESAVGDPGTEALTHPVTYDIEEDEIWYYVSRRHLTSASPTFERMLSGMNWKEGIRDENDGLYHVTTMDWDSEALLYVFQILHHCNRQVPRTISLEMLAKIAVLIDFYKCAEALESFTERWVEHLQIASPVPSYFCRDTMIWMCIAWVLRLPQEFAQTTTVAIRRDDQELPTLGLPITICVGE